MSIVLALVAVIVGACREEDLSPDCTGPTISPYWGALVGSAGFPNTVPRPAWHHAGLKMPMLFSWKIALRIVCTVAASAITVIGILLILAPPGMWVGPALQRRGR